MSSKFRGCYTPYYATLLLTYTRICKPTNCFAHNYRFMIIRPMNEQKAWIVDIFLCSFLLCNLNYVTSDIEWKPLCVVVIQQGFSTFRSCDTLRTLMYQKSFIQLIICKQKMYDRMSYTNHNCTLYEFSVKEYQVIEHSSTICTYDIYI